MSSEGATAEIKAITLYYWTSKKQLQSSTTWTVSQTCSMIPVLTI